MYKYFKITLTALVMLFNFSITNAQDATALFNKIKAKLNTVNDYSADATMRTNITFIKVPVGKVKFYYKKPNKIKIVRDKGISILPKGGLNFNNATLLSSEGFTAIFTGDAVINNVKTKIITLLPTNAAQSSIAVCTLYADEANALIRKTAITTKENGSFETEWFYGSQNAYGLPDKLVVSFNLKDYKMPKGVTLDFDDDMSKAEKEKLKGKKGKIEFIYSNYTVNKGINDALFK